jgi:hypothetical protein|tara:strand:- start:474 stop:731 length:258 start_codon:yes stop_codon:yes gene_type:complete
MMRANEQTRPSVTLTEVKLEPGDQTRVARLAFTFSVRGAQGQALICLSLPCRDGETLAHLGEAAWTSLESFLSEAQGVAQASVEI